MTKNQLLIGSVMIDAELGREDHGSIHGLIHRNCDQTKKIHMTETKSTLPIFYSFTTK
jgi:hypothetical protein